MLIKIGEAEIDLSAVPEDQQQAIADQITEAHEADVTGLKTKNQQLIASNKTLKERGAGDESKEVQRLLDQVQELSDKNVELSSKATIAENAAKRMETKLQTVESTAGEWKGKHDDLVIEQGLSAALLESGVTNPALLKAAKAMHKSAITLGDDGLLMGDKPLQDSLKSWAEGDEGKAFISAGGNSGGNAGNLGNGNVDVKDNPFAKETFNLTKQGELTRTQPEVAEQLKAAAQG